MKSNKTVDTYLLENEKWLPILEKLRSIMLHCNLEETVKWGAPMYTFEGKNIVGMAAFKNYAALWFFQGALLSDPKNILVNAQKGKTQALRQIRFPSWEDVDEEVLREYVHEAILNMKSGREIKPTKNKPLIIPELLQDALTADENLRQAFQGFSLSRQREFAEYVLEAKRQETKLKRLQKILPMILERIGLNDKYRK